MTDTSDELRPRRSVLYMPAANERALEKAGMTADEIDCIVVATISPDYFFPGTGVFLQRPSMIEENMRSHPLLLGTVVIMSLLAGALIVMWSSALTWV